MRRYILPFKRAVDKRNGFYILVWKMAGYVYGGKVFRKGGIGARLKQHTQQHEWNHWMMNVYAKHGPPDFLIFFDMCAAPENEILDREQGWLKKHVGKSYCMNLTGARGLPSAPQQAQGRKAGKHLVDNKLGPWAASKEQVVAWARKGNKAAVKQWGSLTDEQREWRMGRLSAGWHKYWGKLTAEEKREVFRDQKEAAHLVYKKTRRLEDWQIVCIYMEYEFGCISYSDLATKYNYSKGSLRSIVHGLIYKDVWERFRARVDA